MGAVSDEWDSIKADPEFRAQPPAEQTRVALSFFNKRYAPVLAAHAEDVDQARHEFFSDAFKAPEPVAQPSNLSMAGSAVKDTLKSPVPHLAPVADALRTTVPQAISDAGERAGFPKVGAALGTAVGTVGELVPKTGGELALAGLGGPAIEGAGALGAKVAPQVVSSLTGRSLPEAQRAISRAAELMNPTLLKPETVDNATKALGESVKAMRSAIGRRLGVAEDAAAAKLPGRVVATGQVADDLTASLQKAGYAVDGKARGDVPNKLPPQIQEIVDKLRNVSPAGLLGPDGNPLPKITRPLSLPDALQVKRDIYKLVTYDPSHPMAVGTADASFLKDAADDLNFRIRAVGGDELNAATDKFSDLADAYDHLHKEVMAGRVDTIQKRLGRLFASGDVERKAGAPIGVIGAGRPALDTLLDAKTAQGMAPMLNPGITGPLQRTGGGLAARALELAGAGTAVKMAPGTMAQKLGGIAALGAVTSPRLINAGIRATMVPIGESAAVDALASPTARALTGTTVLRKLLTRGK